MRGNAESAMFVMHEARLDGDLQPVGRDSSKTNAG